MISIRDIFKAKSAGDKVLLNELSLKRVLDLQAQVASPNWAIVTVDSIDVDDEENTDRRCVLCSRVQNLGYGISRLDSVWTLKPTDIAGSNLDSRFVQRVIFIHGITLKHLQRLMGSLGLTKALFGYSSGMAMIEPGGSIRRVGEVSTESITNIWGARWCSGWRFEGFGLVPQGFIENVIEGQFRRNVERMGLDQVIRDQDMQPSPGAP